MIREVGLLLSESLERTRDVEPGALVCDCDQRALAGRRHLDDNGLCGVAAVAVFRGIAESIPQRYQQIRQQVRPRHRGETVRQDNLEQRKQIVPPVAPKSQMNICVRDPWVGDVAHGIGRQILCLDLREEVGPRTVRFDHTAKPNREPGTDSPRRRARGMPSRRDPG